VNSFCYIHIPFCESKCKYCRFASVWDVQSLRIAQYVHSLCEEITSSPFLVSEWLQSVYFWWGTPSTLTTIQIKKIIETLENKYGFSKNIEISLESTPNKMEKEYIAQLKEIGINRVSIWVQSLNHDTLKEIWRGDKWDIMNSLNTIWEVGFENISLDFIIWLPYAKKWQVKKDIKYLLDTFWFIKHVSVYMLEDYYEPDREEKSKFHNVTYPDNWDNLWIKPEDYQDEYLEVTHFLEKNWFFKYEISNFAKPWYESKHNSAYWDHSEVLAFGLWASWLMEWERYTNSEIFQEYYSRKNISKELLAWEDIFLEKIMFWLRTTWVSKSLYSDLNKNRIDNFIQDGLLFLDTENKKLRITDKWTVFLDYIIKEII
jgi:oxygen-independent coproporphyrinogen-3 oxidase